MYSSNNTVFGNDTLPMGIVTNIEGGEALLWAFPRAVFGPEEIQINLTGKTALHIGDCVYLKERNKGEFLFKIPNFNKPRYMESSVNSKGILELRGFVLLKRTSTSEYEAWSPDLGKVAAITRKDYKPGLYDVTFIRTKEKFKLFNHNFAIALRKPIVYVDQISAGDSLQHSKVQNIGIVVGENKDYYYAWSSPFGLVNAFQKKKSLIIGSWIRYYSEWSGYGQESSVITDYEEILPKLRTYYCGNLYVAVSSDFVGKALLRSCSFAQDEVVKSPVVVWKESRWEICEKFLFLFNESSTNMVTASPQRMRPKHCPEQLDYVGIAVQGNDDSTSCQLFVCPLKGEPLISIKYPWYGDETEKIKPGDWVSVQAYCDPDCGYVSKFPARKAKPLLLSRLNCHGIVEVQTCIKNIWHTEFDVYGVSDDIGIVKDIYEAVPECDSQDQFLVWCTLLTKPVDGCFWAVAKGEIVEKTYRNGKKEGLEVPPSRRHHEDSEGYYSDERSSALREENNCNPSGEESYCKGTTVPPGFNITVREFLASVRRLFDDQKLQKLLYNQNKNLFLEIQECLDLQTDGTVRIG